MDSPRPTPTGPIRLRLATPADGAALAEIYAPIVERTHISFELEPPDGEEMARRIRAYREVGPCLVCVEVDPEGAETVLGYAYAAPFRPRPAYRFAVETSVYVAERGRRRGVASALYRALLACLSRQGHVTVVAGISLPNPGSVALHERLGFAPVARLPSIGFKLGGWHDVGYWALALREAPTVPAEPVPPEQVGGLQEILDWEAQAVRGRPGSVDGAGER